MWVLLTLTVKPMAVLTEQAKLIAAERLEVNWFVLSFTARGEGTLSNIHDSEKLSDCISLFKWVIIGKVYAYFKVK